MSFSTLGLNDRVVQGTTATGFTTPTEIQSRAIPVALQGRDVVGLAQTGTGKTAAFVLPMLNKFSEHKHRDHHVRGLVLTPTRELAHQIEDAVTSYGRFTNISVLSVYGGVSMDNQIRRLRRGVDIIIATPGRLLDHMSRRTIDLSHVEVLVLDEADRMFDMGFIKDVQRIVEKVPKHRQTMLFSATMPEEIRKLTMTLQKDPETIRIGKIGNPVASVTQYFYSVPQERKTDLLAHVLEAESMKSVLVFSRTKHGADKISRKLEQKGFSCTMIHSNRSQSQRQHALAGFKQGRYRVLIATDIAARGIDVEGISHVINYDTPPAPEDYVHRIGRTGRAAAIGDAITFVSEAERGSARRIGQTIGKPVDLKKYTGFDYNTPLPRHEKHSGPAAPPASGHRRRTESRPHPAGDRRQPERAHSDRRNGEHPERKHTARPHGISNEHPDRRSAHPSASSKPGGREGRPSASHGRPGDRTNRGPKGFKPRGQRTETGRPSRKENSGSHEPRKVYTKSDWTNLLTSTEKDEKKSFRKKLKRFFGGV